MTMAMAAQVRAAPGGDQAARTAAASLSQAAALASTCSGCHAGQNAGTALVSLRGLAAREIEARMGSFKKEPDGPTAMHRLARGYTDAQIALIARYIASPAAR
jgi:cytochrome c553